MVENVGNDPTTSHYLYFDNNFLFPWTITEFFLIAPRQKTLCIYSDTIMLK